MESIIKNLLDESIKVKKDTITNSIQTIIKCAEAIASCVTSGHKLMLFGNGGSAADAQHIAAEFINRFRIERPPLPAIALTTDTSIITSIANDYSFDKIFLKQLKAIGKKNDIAIGISTSGNSKNVILALDEANKMGIYTVALTGGDGPLSEYASIALKVASKNTPCIQETHITIGHILCDLVDRILFP